MIPFPHFERSWEIPRTDPVDLSITSVGDLPELVFTLLSKRGITNSGDMAGFLDFNKYIPTSGSKLPDLEKGVERISDAIKNKEVIGVWGDFDVDGQTSTSVMVAALRKLGGQISYHLPVRSTESHGINVLALKTFIDSGIQVILTCDTGVSEHVSVAYAQSRNVDVIITDHHQLPATLPPAYAVINPHRLASNHPLSALPGVGTAYKFVETLLMQSNMLNFAVSLHDLVALGCVADLAELCDDTRYLVQSGLNQIRTAPRLALSAMLSASDVSLDEVTEQHLSFILAPRLNALGRLSDANPSVNFLLSEDSTQIAVMVNQLEGLNARRKTLSEQVLHGALSMLETNNSLLDQPVIILDHPEWPAGVVGIAASRLVELTHKPVILLVSKPGSPMKGSARSINGLDITEVIGANKEHLLSFGGHAMAAGLSLSAENYTAFKRALNHNVRELLVNQNLIAKLNIDAVIQPTFFNLDLMKSISTLAPFGPGNPAPLFAAESQKIRSIVPIGKGKEHLQVLFEDNQGNTSRFLWWHGNGLTLPDGKFDLAYTAQFSNFKGKESIEFEWVDWRKSDDATIKEVSSLPLEIINFDHRFSVDPEAEVSDLSTSKQTIIWKEGNDKFSVFGLDRLGVHPAKVLIVWSLPPNLEVLHSLFQQVKPREAHWFLIPAHEQNLKVFLSSIGGFLKHSLEKDPVTFNLAALAAKHALTVLQVKLGLDWFASQGKIQLTEPDSGSIKITLGGTVDINAQHIIRNQLSSAFSEMKAYQFFLQQADLKFLSSELG